MTKLYNRKSLFLLALFFLLLIVVVLFFRYINQPSTAIISPPKIVNSEIAKTIEPQKYPGPYITFTYPGDFVLEQITEIDPGLLTKIILNTRDFYAKRLIVTLASASASLSNLDEIPAVQFRRLPESKYSETSKELNGWTWLIFEKKDELYEQTAFTIADNVLYTLAYSSNPNAPGATTDLPTVLANLSKL